MIRQSTNTRQNGAEHPFRTIRKLFAACRETGQYPRLLLFTGSEDLLINWAVGFVKGELVNPATEALDFSRFSADTAQAPDIISACETLPMFSTRKVVAVDAEKLFAATKNDAENITSSSLNDYIPDLPETTCLVLISGKVNKTRSLYKSCEKYGIVYDFCELDQARLLETS